MDLASKVKMLLARAKSGSVKRMVALAREAHEKSGKPTLIVLADMAGCILTRGIGYQEYLEYDFASKPQALRRSFMTMSDNLQLVRELNDPAARDIFEDKIRFLEAFGDFIGRDWLDLRQVDASALKEFLDAHPVVFVKPLDSFGGQGIERIESSSVDDAEALYKRLMASGTYLVEEAIVQHPGMAALSPNAVSTLRICTVLSKGEAHLIYALVRMGIGDNHVDNISSGGMYTLIDEDGVLRHPCFHDKSAKYLTVHPTTGLELSGYKIPLFKEAVELCRKAALVEPRVGYVGWDVAITEKGPVLVEGNTIPGYDMPQNAAFHPDGKGILPLFEKVLGRSLSS